MCIPEPDLDVAIYSAAAKVPGSSKAEPQIPATVESKLVIVMNDLRKRGAAKPSTVEKFEEHDEKRVEKRRN